MDLPSTAPLPDRCVNCAVRFQRNVRRQLLSEATAAVRKLISVWISRELDPLDAVCDKCLTILQDSIQTTNTLRRYGYGNICIPCGSLALRAHQTHDVPVDASERNIILQWLSPDEVERLQHVCMSCWMRATRAVQRNRQHDDKRDFKIQPIDAGDSSNSPQPPPKPTRVEPAIHGALSTINMTNYKRAASSNSKCIFRLCKNVPKVLVPTILKEKLLTDHSFYVPQCARICKYHLKEPHNNWSSLYSASNCSLFTASQMDDLCSLLKSYANRQYNIESIIEHNSTLCNYLLGITYCQFMELLIKIPHINERVKSPKTSLAIYLMKLHTGDTNERLASIFNVAASTVARTFNIVKQCFKTN